MIVLPVGDIEMCQGRWVSKIAVDEQEYGDEDGSALEHCNPRIHMPGSVNAESNTPLYEDECEGTG